MNKSNTIIFASVIYKGNNNTFNLCWQ